MAGYTPASPERTPYQPRMDRSQQPDDPDDEDILTSKCPPGVPNASIRTFIFKNQGHTLGNMLRDQLLRYPQVQFCGYSIPHPGENEMHLRVQTTVSSGVPASDMLKKALEDVVEMCEDIEGKFKQELEKKEYATT